MFALACERIFFHVTPSPLSIAGTVVIMSSAIYIAVSTFCCVTKEARLTDDPLQLTKENENMPQPTSISLAADDSAMEEGLLSGQEAEEMRPLDTPKSTGQEKEEGAAHTDN